MPKSAAETHRDGLHFALVIWEGDALTRLCVSMIIVGLIVMVLALVGHDHDTRTSTGALYVLPRYTVNHFYAQAMVNLLMFGLALFRKDHPLVIFGLIVPCILLSGIALYDSFFTIVGCFFFEQCIVSWVDVIICPMIAVLLETQIIGLNAYMKARGAKQQVDRLLM
jgi:hypothetical protein